MNARTPMLASSPARDWFSSTRISAAVTAAALILVLENQSRAGLLASIGVLAFMGLRYALLWRAGYRPRPARGGRSRLGPLGPWTNPALAAIATVGATLG